MAQPVLTLRIHYMKTISRAGDGLSILVLKPMGGVNWSLKQRVPVASQNDDIVTAKIKNKKQNKNDLNERSLRASGPWKTQVINSHSLTLKTSIPMWKNNKGFLFQTKTKHLSFNIRDYGLTADALHKCMSNSINNEAVSSCPYCCLR